MYDVIVVGSGPNGLSSAIVLANAGLSVLVLEKHTEAGGAVRTVESTLPGFKHDVGAAFFPFGGSSPAMRAFRLQDVGLVWRHGALDSAHPALDQSCGVIARDIDRAADLLGPDGPAYRRIAEGWAEAEERLLPTLLAPFPPLVAALRLRPKDAFSLARVALSSGRRFGEATFKTEAARRMFPALALHTDVGPDDAMGAIVGYMLGVTASRGGFAVPTGGAGAISGALLKRLSLAGGTILTGQEVLRIATEGSRVSGVLTRDGLLRARLGVIADTAAPALYLKLLAPADVPSPLLEAMRDWRPGFGTFKVDWALSGSVPWTSLPCREAAVVHTGESNDDLCRFTNEVRAKTLPTEPYLVIGQQSIVDPTRAPVGSHTLWAYSRVPCEPGQWDEKEKAVFLERIEARIEGLAPGFRDLIQGRAVFSPEDLQAMNPNLVRGDLGGGSADIRNQLIFRPVFPTLGYETHLRGLFLGSSYAHPGAGVHAMAGWNAAHELLRKAHIPAPATFQ